MTHREVKAIINGIAPVIRDYIDKSVKELIRAGFEARESRESHIDKRLTVLELRSAHGTAKGAPASDFDDDWRLTPTGVRDGKDPR